MKQLNMMFKPKALLVMSALAAASVVGAQTTNSTTDTSATSSGSIAAKCAGLQGSGLSDCLALNTQPGNGGSASAMASGNTSAAANSTSAQSPSTANSGSTASDQPATNTTLAAAPTGSSFCWRSRSASACASRWTTSWIRLSAI